MSDDERLDSINSRLAAEEQYAEEEIRLCFSQIGKLPLDKIHVPYVAHTAFGPSVRYDNMAETLVELIREGDGEAELLELLATPQAAKLRKVLEDKHVLGHATEIAQARV